MRKIENTNTGPLDPPSDVCASPGESRGAMPSLLEVHSLRVRGEEWFILTHPLSPGSGANAFGGHPGGDEPRSPSGPRGLESLPTALREVARLAMSGLDNASIASARGTSVRTVAKQLEGIYRRLGVGSRLELITRFGESLADVS